MEKDKKGSPLVVFSAMMSVAQVRNDEVRLAIDKKSIKGIAIHGDYLSFPRSLLDLDYENEVVSFVIVVTRCKSEAQRKLEAEQEAAELKAKEEREEAERIKLQAERDALEAAKKEVAEAEEAKRQAYESKKKAALAEEQARLKAAADKAAGSAYMTRGQVRNDPGKAVI